MTVRKERHFVGQTVSVTLPFDAYEAVKALQLEWRRADPDEGKYTLNEVLEYLVWRGEAAYRQGARS